MAVSYRDILLFTESSAAMRMIRGLQWVEDIAFLMHAFRNNGTIVIPESELKSTMTRWQEITFAEIPERHPDWKPAERIAYYVRQVFLKKREPANSDEPTYELTPEMDRILMWMEDQRHREFVGTEYGLKAIIRDLNELSAHASGNWEKRVDALKIRRDKIQEEIDLIQRDANAASPQPRYVLENLQRLERASQELVSDFSVLRERFSELTRDIARQHGGVSTRRGDMLRLALDGEDALRKTPMGESFYGFWKLVASS